MPSDPLSHLIETLDFAWRRESACPATLTNIQWRADACDPGSILFFQRFADGKSDGEIYRALPGGQPLRGPGDQPDARLLRCHAGQGDLRHPARGLGRDGAALLRPRLPAGAGRPALPGRHRDQRQDHHRQVSGVHARGSGAAGPDHRHLGRLPQRPIPRGDRLHLPAPDRVAPLAARRTGEGAMWWPWRSAAMPWTRGGSMASPCGTPAGPTSPRTIWIITATRRPTSPPRPASST
jgi:hypothetical protein